MDSTRFTFSYDYTGDSTGDYVSIATEGTKTIYELVEKFEDFLRATGYHFNGHLEFVDDGLDTSPLWDYETADLKINIDDYPIFQNDLPVPQSPVVNDLIKPQDC